MLCGEKISSLRKSKGMTQTELGEKLNVTYQAVSKWERDESLPDFETMSKLAKLFGVPLTYFEDNGDAADNTVAYSAESQEAAADAEPAETVYTPKVLGVCTQCGKILTEGEQVPDKPKLICKNCNEQNVNKQKQEEADRKHKIQMDKMVVDSTFNKRLIWACIVAGVISVGWLITGIVSVSIYGHNYSSGEIAGAIAIVIVSAIAAFSWIFQLFWDGIVREVTLFGGKVIKLPGIIFSADLDGLIFLLVMKILFFIITCVVFVFTMAATIVAGMVVSLFTFIPTVIKIKNRNEDIL